jgi:hypothetical protein
MMSQAEESIDQVGTDEAATAGDKDILHGAMERSGRQKQVRRTPRQCNAGKRLGEQVTRRVGGLGGFCGLGRYGDFLCDG